MFKSFLAGLTIGGVGTLVGMHYHVVRTADRVLIVARVHQPPLRSTYVDIRSWNPGMWSHYPELEEAVVKAGRQDLLTQQPSPVPPSQTNVSEIDDNPLSGLLLKSPPATHPVNAQVPQPLGTPQNRNAASSTQRLPEASSRQNLVTLQGLTILPDEPAEPGFNGDQFRQTTALSANPIPGQRAVPDPLDPTMPVSIAQNSASTSNRKVPAKSMSTGSTPAGATGNTKRDWVRGLLRNIMPGTEGAARGEQVAVPVPEGLQQTARSLLDETAASDELLPKSVQDSFPSSPRRISIQ